jgi:hypothetical protein
MHFRQVVQHTPAAGDTVGKIAARAGAKMLGPTHHRRDFTGRVIVGEDLTEIEV